MIKFDPSIALGSMIHLGVLVMCLAFIWLRASIALTRIEKKQDQLIGRLKNDV